MLYNTLVLPHFNYASIVWSNTCASYTSPLDILQARAGRLILGLPKLTSKETVLGKLGWSSLSNRWDSQRAVMMFKVAQGLAPEYLTASFTPISADYVEGDVETRGSEAGNFKVKDSATECGRRRFTSHGAFLWNKLSPDLKGAKNVSDFKTRLKHAVRTGEKFYSL